MPQRQPSDTYRVTHSRGLGDRSAGDAVDRTWRLLSNGIPLTLLLDLVSPHGPDSVRIAEAEGGLAV